MRSQLCGELCLENTDETVIIEGWINRNRRHGSLIFVDLRDYSGIIQIVIEPDTPELVERINSCRSEYVIRAEGVVRKRMGAANPDMPTGEIEVLARDITILNTAKPLPFQLDGPIEAGEDIRLKYRYLELRRADLQQKIIFRSRLTQVIRNYFDQNGFLDIETPMLTRATPEGARDYVVPSRIYPGKFFALPQSPQLFKQLLMISGFDRYYQIVKCFRDEDLRADRQPEFTQVDVEMSFMDEKAIRNVAETMLKQLFVQLKQIKLDDFPCITYAEAMRKYGSDKPDLRIPGVLTDVDDLVKTVEFAVFSAPANSDNGRVAALRVPGGASLSRGKIDQYTQFVKTFGAKGLAWMKVNAVEKGVEGLQSPIIKFLGTDIPVAIAKRTQAENGDLIFFGADDTSVVNESMGALRNKLGEDLSLYSCEWAPLWVVDFPMFEYDSETGWTALHHPFTAPACSEEALLASPGEALSRAYDLVLNGFEIGGGSIRIHQKSMQQAVFKLLAIDEQEQQEKFGFLLDALQYGAPPHGGFALGLDRIAMLMTHAASIREVIAFPKTLSSSCLMTQAPSEVDEEQLQQINIKVHHDTNVSNPS
ncbi:MAG: aspartate--tRNA ligase [Endozoicomonadaceae bacterium]|nr:aspartate--tRNA ligase [Endozoicomonadaceae bacterium]